MIQLRLMPILIFAFSALLVLKVAGLVLGNNVTFGVQVAQGGEGEGEGEAKPAPPPVAPAPAAGAAIQDLTAKTLEELRKNSAEKDLLDALSKRRDELDKRAAELDLREKLLQAAQAKMEQRLAELTALEQKMADDKKKQMETYGDPTDQIKSMAGMYEQMKPKEAASIFEQMDIEVVLQLARAISPRKMSAILAAMNPTLAGQITAKVTHPPQMPGAPAPVDPNAPAGGTPPDPSQAGAQPMTPMDPSALPKIGAAPAQ